MSGTLPARLIASAAALGIFCIAAGCSRSARDVYQGYVEGEFVYMASSQAGQLLNLAVERGQTVGVGALLFTLEAQSETDAVHQAGEQLKAAQAQLADLRTGKRNPELEVAEAQLAQARGRSPGRTAAEARRGAIRSRRHRARPLEDSRANHAIKAARVRELEGQLEVVAAAGAREQIRAQNAQVAAARAAMAQAAVAARPEARAAPQAGLVFDTLYREGEWVPAGSPVVRMLPPENIKVRFFVPEAVLGALKPGASVRLHCDGCAATIPRE